MGKTGRSAAMFFKKSKAKVYCWDDDKKIRKKIKKLNLPLYKFWLKKDVIDTIVISPGIDIYKCKIKKFLKRNIKKIITDIDIFFEINKKAQIISITGTNGKSTTCKIIERILKADGKKVRIAGNIGNPILNLKKTKKNIFVLEISSYQLQYSKLFRSKHAAILNISPDHLDRHKNIKNYIKIKSKIFFAQNSSDYSYVNLRDKYSKGLKKIHQIKKLKSRLVSINRSGCEFLLTKIKNKYLKREGNIENFAFAYQIVKKLNVKDKVIIRAMRNFKGLPHRQQTVLSTRKALYINDSKATSFDASLQSLLNYDKIYWIVGGLPKYKDSFKLNKVYKKIIKAYIIGKHTSFFRKQIGKKVTYFVSNSLQNALKNIHHDMKNSSNGKCTILLSPAAASFDQFSNFESRGISFTKLVKSSFKKNPNV